MSDLIWTLQDSISEEQFFEGLQNEVISSYYFKVNLFKEKKIKYGKDESLARLSQ